MKKEYYSQRQGDMSADEYLEQIITNDWYWVSKRRAYEYDGSPTIRERITCSDGFSISVQASRYHYCRPRTDYATKYTRVEAGFSRNGDWRDRNFLRKYEKPSMLGWPNVIYPYIPVDVISELLSRHTREYRIQNGKRVRFALFVSAFALLVFIASLLSNSV